MPNEFVTRNGLVSLDSSRITGSLSVTQNVVATSFTGSLQGTASFASTASFVPNGVIGTGSSGQVAFWNGTSSQTGDSEFIWNNSTKRLLIGNPAIQGKFSLVGSIIMQSRTDAFQNGYIQIRQNASDVLDAGMALESIKNGVTNVRMDLATDNISFSTNTIGSTNVLRAVIFSDGNLGLNTSFVNAGFRLDVNGTTRLNGLQTFQGTTASDTAPLGSELATTGSGTNWTGTGFATGYTHTVGSTASLTTSIPAVNGTYYQIAYTITGRTAGSITINYGGTSTASITATGATGPLATSTANLEIVPTTDFDGTVVLSVRSIGTSSATTTINDSGGNSRIQIRATSTSNNTLVGNNAGRRITTGTNNSFYGNSSGTNTTTGINNSFFGQGSGNANTIGFSNSFFGVSAGLNNSTGGSNSFFGVSSGNANTIGINNSFFGTNSGLNNTTGVNNSFFGLGSGANNTTGFSNTFIGLNAGRFIADGVTGLTTPENSVFLGFDTRANSNGQTNQIVIGASAIGLGSNTTVIGNSSTTFGRWWGNLLLGTSTNSGFLLDVNGTTRLSGNTQVTGSLLVSGSLQTTGSLSVTQNVVATSFTGSLQGTASFATQALSASFATTASFVPNGVIGTGSSGQVAFWNGTSSQTGDAGLTWDNTNKFLTLTRNTDLATFTLLRFNTTRAWEFRTVNDGVNTRLELADTTAGKEFRIVDSTLANSGISILPRINSIDALTGLMSIRTLAGNGNIALSPHGTGSVGIKTTSPTATLDVNGTGRIRNGVSLADTSGNVQIGTTTDAGFKLDVLGTTRLNGNTVITGSLTTTQNIIAASFTGSLSGSATFTTQSLSASFASTASFVNPLVQNVLVTGSILVSGSLNLSGSAIIVPVTNSTALTISNYFVTESSAVPAIDISGTFNTTGQANAIRVNITNTASSTASNLLNLQVGGSAIFRVQTGNIGGVTGGGPIALNGYGFGGGNIAMYLVNSSTSIVNSSGTAINFSDNSISLSGYSYHFVSQQYNNRDYTSGTGGFVTIQRGFAPTSGTGVLNVLNLQNTINQTGGANGITRGLYVNPTLTSAADWRSIEWSNNTGWGLYGIGTANNYLNGTLGIGTTNLTGCSLRVQKAITGATIAFGIAQAGAVQSDVTTFGVGYYNALSTQATSFTLGSYNHFYCEQSTIGLGSTVTSQNGFRVDSSLIGATSNFGFRGLIPSGTGRWNIYMDGTADNYLAGKLGIGSTTLTDINFRVSNSLTGSNAPNSVLVDGTVTSSATSSAIYFNSISSTQAASFTLPILMHYRAGQSVFGLNSVVTNQYGFFVSSGLTGAINNFAFRGEIPSGTGRWNLYMNGTANNYLQGNLLLNTTTDAGFLLDVNGTTRLSGNTQVTGSLTVTTGSSVELRVTETGVAIGSVITDNHPVTGSILVSGSINVLRAVSASAFTGSFVGNGSQLTNLPASNPFPFTGSAIISGSLVVTGSILANGNVEVANQIYVPVNAKGNSSGSVTFNWNDGNIQSITLTGSCTFAFSNPQSGATYQIIMTQDTTGSRTVTWPTIRWAGASAPTLTGTTGSVDIATFTYDGANYNGVFSSNFRTP